MKILSSFKDYYDYLQGIYGVDEKIVYERTPYSQINAKGEWIKSPLYKPAYYDTVDVITYNTPYAKKGTENTKRESHTLAICGIMYNVIILNDKSFYFGLNVADRDKGKYKHIISSLDKDTKTWFEAEIHRVSSWKENKYHLKKTDLNEKENCPVLLLETSRYDNHSVKAKNIKLTDFGINQIISPHDIYIMISNFLSREVPVIDNRTDKQKITGRGFDVKKSFRKEKA